MKESMSFEQFKLNKQLLNAIEEAGYKEPTDIQEKAIPRALAGHDILGIAQTGTGKTAAFVLPMLMKIKYAQGDSPRALILVPTRELVIQIAEHAQMLAKYTDLRIFGGYGGVGMKPQQEVLRKGVDIIVATPGRFWDLYKTGDLVTKKIHMMVLDEADRMMDMGFMPQINMILEIIPRKRQNLLFSATMPERMVNLTRDFLESPERIEVTPQASTVDTIDQFLYYVPNFRTKADLLLKLLEDESLNRVMVFVRKRTNAENLSKFLDRNITESV